MKSVKKFICLLLCAAMVLSLFAACGGQSDEAQSTVSTTPSTESVTTTDAPTESTEPETTPAPTEPPVTFPTVDELEERINQEMAARNLPYEIEFTFGRYYGIISASLHPIGHAAPIPDNWSIRTSYNLALNAITEISLCTPQWSNQSPNRFTTEQQALFQEFGAAFSMAFDPACSETALSIMRGELPSEPGTEYVRKDLTEDILLEHSENHAQITYENRAGDAAHYIGNWFDGNHVYQMDAVVYSTLDLSAYTEPIPTDLSSYITAEEFAVKMNQKLKEMSVPLEYTIRKSQDSRGWMIAQPTYTGEYSDPATNEMIWLITRDFYMYIQANGKDQPVRAVSYSYGVADSQKPEFLNSFVGMPFDEFRKDFVVFIAQLLDPQAPDDMLTDLSHSVPYDTHEALDGYGNTITHSDRSGVYSGLFCRSSDAYSQDGVFQYCSYEFQAIDLLSDKFDPYIPHGEEVNEPQYLEYDFLYFRESLGVDYIPYISPFKPSRAYIEWFCEGTYSPVSLKTYKIETSTADIIRSGFYVYDDDLAWEGWLDIDHYGMLEFHGHTDNMVSVKASEWYLYYNTNYSDYFPYEYLDVDHLSPEYALRVPIGASLAMDVGMTAEEVSRLHTHQMEATEIWRDYQVTVYCPRDVIHILLFNPETGGNQYWLMFKSHFDTKYANVASFLDEKAESKYYIDP